jgi:hypothetical protein
MLAFGCFWAHVTLPDPRIPRSRALIGPLITSHSLALVFAKFDAFIRILFKGSSGRGALFKEKTLELLDGSEAPRPRAAILLATSCIDFPSEYSVSKC